MWHKVGAREFCYGQKTALMLSWSGNEDHFHDGSSLSVIDTWINECAQLIPKYTDCLICRGPLVFGACHTCCFGLRTGTWKWRIGLGTSLDKKCPLCQATALCPVSMDIMVYEQFTWKAKVLVWHHLKPPTLTNKELERWCRNLLNVVVYFVMKRQLNVVTRDINTILFRREININSFIPLWYMAQWSTHAPRW